MHADETIPISGTKLIVIADEVDIFKLLSHLLMGEWRRCCRYQVISLTDTLICMTEVEVC